MMKKKPEHTLFCFRSENWGEVWMKLSGVWGCSNPHDKRTSFIWYEILNHREEETQEKQTDTKRCMCGDCFDLHFPHNTTAQI